jgi:hypothetical protein
VSDPNFQNFCLVPSFDRAGGACRGLLVSEDYALRLGSWHKFDKDGIITTDEEAIAYIASNAEYFRDIKRGPIFEQREAKRKAEEEAKRSSIVPFNNHGSNGYSASNQYLNRANIRLNFDIKDFEVRKDSYEALTTLFDNLDCMTDAGLADLSMITHEEILDQVERMYKENKVDVIVTLIEVLSECFAESLDALALAEEQVRKLEEKKAKKVG